MNNVHYKYAYYDSYGKRRVKTFTAETLPKAKRLAKIWEKDNPRREIPKMTVKDCIDGYLTVKQSVLSPSTYRSYKSIAKTHFSQINNVSIIDMKKSVVQMWVSDMTASGLSAKTVRNCYALLRSALVMYDDGLSFKIQLPQTIPYDNYCPSDADVQKLIDALKKKGDATMLLGILLCAFGPLREGELCALTSDDIHGNVITVNKSLAYTADRTWVLKTPKTPSSIRELEYPDFVIDLAKGIEGRLVPLTPHAFYDRFRRLMKSTGIPYFRVHDLRHYGASIMHAMGIPDLYILQRGGWASDSVMKKVYRNVISDEQKKQTEVIMNHFGKFG